MELNEPIITKAIIDTWSKEFIEFVNIVLLAEV